MVSACLARRPSSLPYVEETPWPARCQHWLIIQSAPSFKLLLLSRQLKLICARTSTERPKTEQNTMIDYWSDWKWNGRNSLIFKLLLRILNPNNNIIMIFTEYMAYMRKLNKIYIVAVHKVRCSNQHVQHQVRLLATLVSCGHQLQFPSAAQLQLTRLRWGSCQHLLSCAIQVSIVGVAISTFRCDSCQHLWVVIVIVIIDLNIHPRHGNAIND